jgi:hypothetical protein
VPSFSMCYWVSRWGKREFCHPGPASDAVAARAAAAQHSAPAGHCSGHAAMISGVPGPATSSDGGYPSRQQLMKR